MTRGTPMDWLLLDTAFCSTLACGNGPPRVISGNVGIVQDQYPASITIRNIYIYYLQIYCKRQYDIHIHIHIHMRIHIQIHIHIRIYIYTYINGYI